MMFAIKVSNKSTSVNVIVMNTAPFHKRAKRFCPLGIKES